MKSKEEIANKYGVLSGKDNEFDKTVLKAMEEYANQCQEDMADEIKEAYEQGLKDGYACMPSIYNHIEKRLI